MVTKLKKATATKAPDAALSSSVKDSAQQIWQAGLGAFTKAQAGGTKAFEALVKEGVSFQRKTQSVAEEKISEATQKMTNMATDISSKASGQWDKLESIFEDRVSKALNKLGVPSAKDIDALIARIDALNASVQKLSPSPEPTKPAPKKRTTKATAKPAAMPVAVAAPAPSAEPEVKPTEEVPAKTRKAAVTASDKPVVKRAPRKATVKAGVAAADQGNPA